MRDHDRVCSIVSGVPAWWYGRMLRRLRGLLGRRLRRLLGRDDPLLSPAIQKRLNPPSPSRMVCDHIVTVLGWSLAVGVAAWLVGSILGVYHFRQLALWGWLNTILITPLVWLVLVLGLVKTSVSLVMLRCAAAAALIKWAIGTIFSLRQKRTWR